MLAEQVRVDEGVMNRWDINSILNLMMTVAMVVIPILFVGLSVECLPGEVLSKALQSSVVGHALVIVLAAVMSVSMNTVSLWLGLHLEDEIASLGVGIIRVEDARVGLETSTCLMPAASIEIVEIVTPVEPELILVDIVVVHLDIVVEDVPWHISGVEAMSPRIEGRSPEVHSEGLGLAHVVNGLLAIMSAMSDLVPIDLPADVVGGPLHLVDVPVVARVEPVSVFV